MPQAAATGNREGEVWHPVVVVAVRAPAEPAAEEREQVVAQQPSPFPPAVPVMDESALGEPEPRSQVVVRWLGAGHQTAAVAAAEPALSADWNSLAAVNWSAAQANCLPSPTGLWWVKPSDAGYPGKCSAVVGWSEASAVVDWLASTTGSLWPKLPEAGYLPRSPPGTTWLRAR